MIKRRFAWLAVGDWHSLQLLRGLDAVGRKLHLLRRKIGLHCQHCADERSGSVPKTTKNGQPPANKKTTRKRQKNGKKTAKDGRLLCISVPSEASQIKETIKKKDTLRP